jgi:branched-chain amino acid transport system ATP-binding protein
MMSSASTLLLEVEGLGVSYGALVALDAVDWHVGAGEILGIIGPNGAGKSSCYDAVTNLTRRRGRVRLGNEDVTAVAPDRLATRGLKRAFQQNAFFHDLSVAENMLTVLQDRYGTGLLATIMMPWREAARRQEARLSGRDLLLRFGIPEELHDLRPTNIPYGSQRMLSIALAYGSGAKVLMLDEPAAGLGGADMAKLIALLRELKAEGLGLVVIEHHMDLIMAVADRIVVLDQGKRLATGTPREIQADARVLEAYLGRAE